MYDDRISMELSILYFDGSHWSKFLNFNIFLSLKIVFIYQIYSEKQLKDIKIILTI